MEGIESLSKQEMVTRLGVRIAFWDGREPIRGELREHVESLHAVLRDQPMDPAERIWLQQSRYWFYQARRPHPHHWVRPFWNFAVWQWESFLDGSAPPWGNPEQ